MRKILKIGQKFGKFPPLRTSRKSRSLKPSKRSGEPAYRTWQAMKSRCNNPRNQAYENYGGRGIGIEDPHWQDYESFLADMGDRPDGMTLDRKKVEEGYSKENCRWATPSQQAQNRRNTKLSLSKVKQIFIMKKDGATVEEIAKQFKCSPRTIVSVLKGRSWKNWGEDLFYELIDGPYPS